jgi:hypothetical protein
LAGDRGKTSLAAVIKDEDGTRFKALATLATRRWEQTRLTAANLQLTDDSPVQESEV